MTRPYPPEFWDWTPEARDAFFAEGARDYREGAGNGASKAGFDGFVGDRGRGFSENENWEIELVCASTIKPEPISWLWVDWLARGKFHVLAGQPGGGKTTIAMKIAAAVSSGGKFPDGTKAKQGNVIIWSGEDTAKDVLVPRIEASGGDLSHVFFAGDMINGKGKRAFDPAKDIDALKRAISNAGGAALIIIDPIVSATAADSHKNGETRRGLQPLVDMAENLNAALFGITHFTKGSEGRSPIDRVTGSVAFGAMPRVVMIAAQEQPGEEGKPGRRVFMRAKSNIGPDDGGFEYDLQLVPMREYPDIIASVVSWGIYIEGNARDILAAVEEEKNGEEISASREATDFLLDLLKDGNKSAKECKAAATAAGISQRTLARTKAKQGIASVKDDFLGGWVWQLPKDAKTTEECQETLPRKFGNLGNLGTLRGESVAIDDDFEDTL
jgi:putative DNA primase/helicase